MDSKTQIRLTLIDQIFTTCRTLIRATAGCLAVYFLTQGITTLAGRQTNVIVDIAFSVLADFKFMLTMTLAGTATAWAIAERRLRHRKTEYLQNRIQKLEKHIDPHRSTSGLTSRGETNPKDIVQ